MQYSGKERKEEGHPSGVGDNSQVMGSNIKVFTGRNKQKN